MSFFPRSGFFHESRETKISPEIGAPLHLLSIHAASIKVWTARENLRSPLIKIEKSLYDPKILLSLGKSFTPDICVFQMHFIKHGFEKQLFGIWILIVDFLENYFHELTVKNKMVFFRTFVQIVLHFGKAVIFSGTEILRVWLHMLS